MWYNIGDQGSDVEHDELLNRGRKGEKMKYWNFLTKKLINFFLFLVVVVVVVGGGGGGVILEYFAFFRDLLIPAVIFNIATFVFRFFDGTLPPYLSSFLSVYTPSRTLRSSSDEKPLSSAK